MNNDELQLLVFNSLGACNWFYDMQQGKVVFSDDYLAMLGYQPNERVINPDWVRDNIHPKDISQWRQAFQRCIKGLSDHFDHELRFKHKDDYYIWIQTRGRVVNRDAQQRALQVVGLVFDISERRSTKVAESRYRLFLDNIPDGISLKDRGGRYIYINRQFESWLRKSSFQVYGQTAEEIFGSGFNASASQQHEAQVWEQGKTISMERVFPRTPDGVERHAVITKFPIFDEAGQARAIGSTVTDLSETHQAQQALRESEARFRRLFDTAPISLAEIDMSKGKALVDSLIDQGVQDLRQHFLDRPELLRRRSDVMEVLNLNQEALEIFRAQSRAELKRHLDADLDISQRASVIEDLVSFAKGRTRTVSRTSARRLTGETFVVIRESELNSSNLEDWSQVLVLTRDISAEEAIRVSEKRFRSLFDSAPTVLCETDWSKAKALVDQLHSQGVSDIRRHLLEHPEILTRQDQLMDILTVNRETLKVYRASNEREMIEYIDSDLSASQRLSLIEELDNFARGDRRSIVHCRNFRLDGEEFPVTRVSEMFDADWSQVLIIVRDTSAEEAVRVSEVRYRRLFESAPLALYDTDWSVGQRLVEELRSQGVKSIASYLHAHPELLRRRDQVLKIIDCNSEALRMYKASDKDSLIATLEGEMSELQRNTIIQVIEVFASGNRRSTMRCNSQRADGEVFPSIREAELVSLDRDDWSRVLSSIHDLTLEEENTARLKAYQEELRSLAGKISLAEESERRRISSELHDGTIQNLVLSRIHLANLRSGLETEPSVKLADDINDLLERSLQETRSLIFEISPPVLYELGLQPAVEWLAEHYQKRTGVAVQIISDDGDNRLSEEMNIVMFQTARELLVNIAKHARAKRISVEWRHPTDRVVMIVRDDGIGFDDGASREKAASEGGFGLFAVRERLKLLGAEFDIESSAAGSCITIAAPVIAELPEISVAESS